MVRLMNMVQQESERTTYNFRISLIFLLILYNQKKLITDF